MAPVVPRLDQSFRLNGPYRITPLDALTLIFHDRSGQTHLVAAPIPQILEAIGPDRVNAAEIARRLAAQYDLAGDEDFIEVVTARLAELARLGLIEPVPEARPHA